MSAFPEYIDIACSSTWISQLEPAYWVRPFIERWGGIDQATLRYVLQEGEGWDRVFALFALGHMDVPENDRLLFPFIHSSDRLLRWASRICLGKKRDERVFDVLQELLVDNLYEYGLILEDEELLNQYSWYNICRNGVATLLGDWGNKKAIPALGNALQTCWSLERQPGPFSGRWGFIRGEFHEFQDRVSYALGQLGAFHELKRFEAPTNDQNRISLILAIMGMLQIKDPYFFRPDLVTLSHAQKEVIGNILIEQCGFSPKERTEILENFYDICTARMLEEDLKEQNTVGENDSDHPF